MFDTLDAIVSEKAEQSLVTFTEGTIADAINPEINPKKIYWNMAKRSAIACSLVALSCGTLIAAHTEKKINARLKK